MKSFYLMLLLATLPSAMHTTNLEPYNLNEHFFISLNDDLTPPLYQPGDPIRYNIPIYDQHTREIITTASSVWAYAIYMRMNGLAYFANEIE